MAKRNWERCGVVHDVVCRGALDVAVPRYPRACGDSGARRGSARLGAVCHAVVLPADIFIGGRTTCNRLRGIRTERCFAHLYPRFTARPIQRQPSLPVLALSRLPSQLLARPPSVVPAFLSRLPPFLLLDSLSAAAITAGAAPLKRPRVVLLDVEQRGPAREMTY